MLSRWYKQFRDWFSKQLGRTPEECYIARHELEIPPHDEISKHDVIIVGGDTYTKWIVMRCPCGCSDVLLLPALPNRRPCWHASISNVGIPSISPSIHRQTACKSHFIIRSGRIVWCQ
jgi:hypothetical protein